MMYNKLVQECFFQARHVGVIGNLVPNMVSYRAEYSNASLVIELYLQCSDEGRVTHMCFKTNGNPYMIAALEHLCRQSVGAKLTTLAPLNSSEVIRLLEIPTHQTPLVLQVADVYKEVLVLMKNQLKRGIS